MQQRTAQRSEQRVPQRVTLRNASDRFTFDRSKIPDGMEYGWKRLTLMGQEDTEHQILLEQNGWDAVPPERHPELHSRRATITAKTIVRGGQILMERPIEIGDEARELDEFAAKNQVAAQVQRLGLQGQRAAGKGIKTTYERSEQEVPD